MGAKLRLSNKEGISASGESGGTNKHAWKYMIATKTPEN